MKRTVEAVALAGMILSVLGCGGGSGNGGQSPGAAEKSQGLYSGTTADGDALLTFLLSDGRFWIMYKREAGVDLSSWNGFVYGEGSEAGNRFTSSAAMQFNMEPAATVSSALSVTVQPQQGMTGTLLLDGQDRAISMNLAAYPPLPSAAGIYSTTLNRVSGSETIQISGNLTISPSGGISGMLTGNCTASGSVHARSDARLYNLSMTLSGPSCTAGGLFDGIAYIEASGQPSAATRQLIGLVTTSGRDTGVFAVGISF